jgi:hypothetical protein
MQAHAEYTLCDPHRPEIPQKKSFLRFVVVAPVFALASPADLSSTSTPEALSQYCIYAEFPRFAE